MPVIAETHSHSVASGHAYSTIQENARAAAQAGLGFLCATDHAPAMPGTAQEVYFDSIAEVLPDRVEGVTVLKGAEVNILDYQGRLDLPERVLGKLDWVIASYHPVCIRPSGVAEHTQGWLAVAQNPLVDVIGHCGDGRYPFDLDTVIPAFAQNGKIVEINAHSFVCRPGSAENCRRIALACKRWRVPVVCSSDAHFSAQVGQVEASLALLREIDYPQEWILNLDYDRFLQVARQKSGRPLARMEGN